MFVARVQQGFPLPGKFVTRVQQPFPVPGKVAARCRAFSCFPESSPQAAVSFPETCTLFNNAIV
ncbi:hypothetical protein [Chryseobacterium taichungense]|uniref:hypothetical protein n=1 Tax=Chryseobacterium taichungense TaxID=295069 RepID=UPI00115FBC7C|nr:hypothetical protein [Chryseobacterium taichungense]